MTRLRSITLISCMPIVRWGPSVQRVRSSESSKGNAGCSQITTSGRTNNMAAQIPKDFRTVIVAASVGNVIEWYDFYIFGSLAAILSVKFFEQSHPVAALLSTI